MTHESGSWPESFNEIVLIKIPNPVCVEGSAANMTFEMFFMNKFSSSTILLERVFFDSFIVRSKEYLTQ